MMILIVSFEENEHVETVRRHLSVDSAVVDTSWFPSRMALDARLSGQGESLRLALPDGRNVAAVQATILPSEMARHRSRADTIPVTRPRRTIGT